MKVLGCKCIEVSNIQTKSPERTKKQFVFSCFVGSRDLPEATIFFSHCGASVLVLSSYTLLKPYDLLLLAEVTTSLPLKLDSSV